MLLIFVLTTDIELILKFSIIILINKLYLILDFKNKLNDHLVNNLNLLFILYFGYCVTSRYFIIQLIYILFLLNTMFFSQFNEK
jgi:hypothetical protein